MNLVIKDRALLSDALDSLNQSISGMRECVTSYRYILTNLEEAWTSDGNDKLTSREVIEENILKISNISNTLEEFYEVFCTLLAQAEEIGGNGI